MEKLRRYIEGNHGGVVARCALAWGISYQTLYSWLQGVRSPSAQNIAFIADKTGGEVSFEDWYPTKETAQ